MVACDSGYPTFPVLSTENTDNPSAGVARTNTLPLDLPPERLRDLIQYYEALLDDWDQDRISVGYCHAVIAEARALLAAEGAAA